MILSPKIFKIIIFSKITSNDYLYCASNIIFPNETYYLNFLSLFTGKHCHIKQLKLLGKLVILLNILNK
jgi:hypothetical protein